jgi:hypothetical protein
MDNFDKLYQQLMDTMTAGGPLGMFGAVDNGITANEIGGEKDTYANKDMRNPSILGSKKKNKFQKRNLKIAM